MPKELRYFGCEFALEGCSRRPLKTRKRIEEHEKICWFSPSNRTCATCGYSFYEREMIKGIMPDGSIGHESGNYQRSCLHPEGCKLPKDLETAGPHVRPALNCSSWRHRDDVDLNEIESIRRIEFEKMDGSFE